PAVPRIDAIPAERVDGDAGAPLVDPFRCFSRRVFLLLDVHDLLAADGARVAGGHFHAQLIAHGNRIHLRDGLAGAHPIVENGHAALEVLALHGGAGAELVKRAVLLVHRGRHPFRDGGEARLVRDLHRLPAADGDGLEPLAAHHGAHAGAAGHLVEIIDDAGEPNEVLAGGTDLRRAKTVGGGLGEDRPVDVAGDAAPQVARIAKLHGAVVDPEIDRARRHAVHDDRVPPGPLELGAPVSAGLRLAEASGERRFGTHAVTAGSGHRRARDDAGSEDQHVVGAERVRALRHVLEQVMRDQSPAAGVPTEERVAGLLDPRAAVAEDYVQDLVPVAVPVHRALLVAISGVSDYEPPSIGLNSITSASSGSDV